MIHVHNLRFHNPNLFLTQPIYHPCQGTTRICISRELHKFADSCSFGSQILVFHFPDVVHGVKGGAPNQEPERPFRHLASQLAL